MKPGQPASRGKVAIPDASTELVTMSSCPGTLLHARRVFYCAPSEAEWKSMSLRILTSSSPDPQVDGLRKMVGELKKNMVWKET